MSEKRIITNRTHLIHNIEPLEWSELGIDTSCWITYKIAIRFRKGQIAIGYDTLPRWLKNSDPMVDINKRYRELSGFDMGEDLYSKIKHWLDGARSARHPEHKGSFNK